MMKNFIIYIILLLFFLNISAQGQKVEAYKLKLDSIITFSSNYEKTGFTKFEYNFLDNSQKITSEGYGAYHVYEYDGFAKLVSDSLFRYTNGEKYLSQVQKLDHSTPGIVIDSLFYIQGATFDPDIEYQVRIYEYNEKELLIKEETFKFYKGTNEYKVWETTILSYNDITDFLAEEISSRYSDSGEPYIYRQIINSFNEIGFFIEGTTKLYSEETNQLENERYSLREYDANYRTKITESLSEWDAERNDWSFGYRYDYDYDDAGQTMLEKQSFRSLSDEDNYYWANTQWYGPKKIDKF